MNIALTDLASIIGLIAGIISLGSVVYLAAVKITRLEVRVETMWDFLMRRALSEAIEKGIVKVGNNDERGAKIS